jgi:hypothetical protein
MDWKYLVTATRARVYLVWTILAPLGFVATQFYQRHAINALWTLISIIGLYYMFRVMPMRVRQVQYIFLAWLIPIFLGMCVSGAVFYMHNDLTAAILSHLGAFWLGVMAVGYLLNGLVDPPSGWYWINTGINAVACYLCFAIADFTMGQFWIAAVVSAWSMLNLWLFRSDA